MDQTFHEVVRDVGDLQLPTATILGPNNILDTRVYRKTRIKEYKEHLIRKHGKMDVDIVWINELEFKKLVIDPNILNPRVD